MFGFLRRAWKTVVSWFRPDAGGTHVEPGKPVAKPKTSNNISPNSDTLTPPVTLAMTRVTQELELPKPPPVPETFQDPAVSALPPPAITPPLFIPAPPESAPPSPVVNRAARRKEAAWERERRKHDRFVEPQGPAPKKVSRGPSKPKPVAPPVEEMQDGRILMQSDTTDLVYMESELYGQFTFRDTILDQLDLYWIYLRRMKKNDPGSYGFYCQVGATILPPVSWFLEGGIREDKEDKDRTIPPLSPWWKTHRPSFGCVTYGITPKVEQQELVPDAKKKLMWVPKFLYFMKYKLPPPTVQPTSGGDVYMMCVWWDKPQDQTIAKKMKGGVPDQYAIYISKDGNDIHALPMCKTEKVWIPRKKNGLRHFTIPQRSWSLPREYVNWAKSSGRDVNEMLVRLFVDAAHSVEHAQYSMVRIAVHKDDMTAVFGVEVKRIPYFFQDRDITLTEKGVKQRIFHIVRPHVRKDGATVPMHFRGLKEFTWAGYKVEITVPGRDHFMLTNFDLGVEDSYWQKPGHKYMEEPELGAKIVDLMKQGKLLKHDDV